MRYTYWIAKGRDESCDSGEFAIILRCPRDMDRTAVKGLAISLMRSRNRDDLADYFGAAFDDAVCEVQVSEFNGCQILYEDLQPRDAEGLLC